MQTIDAMRDELAAITKRGVGMPVAGMVYWIAMAALGSRLGPRQAALAMFFGTGAVFPTTFPSTPYTNTYSVTVPGGATAIEAVQFDLWLYPVEIVIVEARLAGEARQVFTQPLRRALQAAE